MEILADAEAVLERIERSAAQIKDEEGREALLEYVEAHREVINVLRRRLYN
ncbi:hypothetical protein [Bradyrhizobium sp. WSM471]|uniref:hypothetical protein n=1 Tax=Bradyrhizobium sp. WSM471 TaxID=319017 RepID=UPI0012F92F07|nr:MULTISPECIES: hypothetical protein [Bradyrhizobium]UFW41374.1 hypothetical protein BcanWSM471_35130 [Bradyrhizobium canariense]